MTNPRKIRVIQWATGNIGTRSLRAVMEHPGMELAGLWVSSLAKVGQDAGTLCGAPETGILATNSVDEMVNTPADCVLYMRQGTDIDELCRLLASGKNVVTTRGDFHHPASMDAGVRARIEAACATGGTSIHSTGSSPGFVTEALAFPLLSLSRRLDCLTIDEFADMASRNSPEMIFGVMGYGVPPGAFDPMKVEYVKHDFAASLAHVAEAAGIEIERWQAFGENAAALEDTQIAAGLIAKGSVAAQRITIEGVRNGQPVLRFRANWFCGRAIDQPAWELRESGWRIRVEGDTPLDVSITFPVAPEDYAAFTPGLTGHRAVNAVPAVCGAAPGIRTTADLPQVVARL